MKASTKSNPKPLRLRANEVVDFARLDDLLDVSVSIWDRTVSKLIRDFRAKGATLEVPASQILSGRGSKIAWTRLFDNQVRGLPRMDRAEEFRMARRYEFMKRRYEDAFSTAGYAAADVERLIKVPPEEWPAPQRRRSAARLDYLRQIASEFEALRNIYVEGGLYLVPAPVRRYRNLGVDEGDLIQEGNASLFQAIDGYDWRREVRFKTYAVFWIQQAILKALYNSSRTVRIPVWVQKAYRKIQRIQQKGLSEDGMAPSSIVIGDELGVPASRVDEIVGVRRFAVSLDAVHGGDEAFTIGQTIPDELAPPIPDQIEEGNLKDSLEAALAGIPERERLILERRFGLQGREPETLAEIAGDLGITAERVRQLQNAAIGRLKKPERIKQLSVFA